MTTVRKRRLRATKAKPVLSVEERLEQAMESLLAKGQRFAGVTVEQLAKEAGIARATFYLHFADKAELVSSLMEKLTDEVVESAGSWFAASSGITDPEDLKPALAGIIGTFRKHHAVLEAAAATSSHDETVAALHDQMMTALCEESRKAVHAANPERISALGVAPDMLADVLTWCIELYCARFIRHYDDQQTDQLITTFAHICHQAIFATE